ncbi:MAG TPA: alpha/beta hydrolase [Ktedonobacterales bacterium]|jgi:pimeloyl-ACP methyl ester carboxylesterase
MLETLPPGEVSGNFPAAPALQEGVVSVRGYRMAYVVGGAGEPIVFLHGLGHASSVWSGVLPHLARRFRVFAVDMLGCGRSDKPRIDYSLGALAGYTRSFMDAVGIERAHLVGHSLGGGVAMHATWHYPERVNRLALVSSGGLGRELRPLLRLATLPGASLALACSTSPAWSWVVVRVRFRKLAARLARENIGMWARLGRADDRRVFLHMLRSVCNITGQTVSAVERLPEVKHPVLLIWGERDTTIPPAHARRAAALIRNCQLQILPGCKHYPPLEQPEVVAPLLEQFLLAPAGLSAAVGVAGLERADHRKTLMDEGGELATGLA